MPLQDGSASAPGTVRRLAGKFEWGAEGKAQSSDSLERCSQGGTDVNGERETPQAIPSGNGSQENGTPGKHMLSSLNTAGSSLLSVLKNRNSKGLASVM